MKLVTLLFLSLMTISQALTATRSPIFVTVLDPKVTQVDLKKKLRLTRLQDNLSENETPHFGSRASYLCPHFTEAPEIEIELELKEKVTECIT